MASNAAEEGKESVLEGAVSKLGSGFGSFAICARRRAQRGVGDAMRETYRS